MEVAAKLGVSTYAVYLWQHGTSVPKPEMFAKICKLTDIQNIITKWETWKNEYVLTMDERK
jgi:transcriptional regulator with XRE-family HTH domain